MRRVCSLACTWLSSPSWILHYIQEALPGLTPCSSSGLSEPCPGRALHPESSLTAPILTFYHLLDISEGLSRSSGTSGLRYKLAPHTPPPSTLLLLLCLTSISCTTSPRVGTPVSLRFPPQPSLKITAPKAYWLSLKTPLHSLPWPSMRCPLPPAFSNKSL